MKQLSRKTIEKLELLDNNFKRWWRGYEGRIIIRNFIIGIQNLIKWFPAIWKDREWDHVFILDILKQKLYFTAKYNIEQEHYVGWEREVELMTTCIKLIGYINSNYYENKIISKGTGNYTDLELGQAYKQHEKAKKLLFHILNERIERWWC